MIASYATMKLRKPVRPAGVLRAFHALIWILRWFVVPIIIFPLAAGAATLGWRGLGLNFFRRSKWLLYAAEVCALLLCAIWIPLKLVAWVPEIPRFSLQMASFLARIAFGYLLFVAALLSIEFLTSSRQAPLEPIQHSRFSIAVDECSHARVRSLVGCLRAKAIASLLEIRIVQRP